MRAVIEAGAEIEFASPAEVRREIELTLAARAPRMLRLKGTGLMPSTGVLVVMLGWPAAGRIWDLRHISVSGADPTVTINGKALICIGGVLSMQQQLGKDPVDPFAVQTATNTMPADADFARHECTVKHMDALYVVFAGVTPGLQMVAHAQVVDEVENLPEVYTA